MFNAIELFAGAGGLAIGSANAGFNHSDIIELNKHACETIRHNQDRNIDPVTNWNLHEMKVQDFDYKNITQSINLVAGGPPCQPFSLGGKHKGRHDSRDMFPEAVRAVRETQPEVFVFENVKGLLRSKFSSYFEYILLQLTYPEIENLEDETWTDHLSRLERYHTKGSKNGLCYNVVFRLLNAADYGVPQTRERVFIVGFRNDLNKEWSFPDPTHSIKSLFYDQWITGDYWERHDVKRDDYYTPNRRHSSIIKRLSSLFPPDEKPWVTVRDALEDVPHPLDEGVKGNWLNHDFNDGARTYKGHTGSPLDLPSKTLKAGAHGVPGGENMIAYPDGSVRYFTVRESARIQTFPDEYAFPGSWGNNMKQLGNAVPVELSHAIMKSLHDYLAKEV